MSRNTLSPGLTQRVIVVCVCLGVIYAALANTAALIFAGAVITVGAALLIFGLARFRGRIAAPAVTHEEPPPTA